METDLTPLERELITIVDSSTKSIETLEARLAEVERSLRCVEDLRGALEKTQAALIKPLSPPQNPRTLRVPYGKGEYTLPFESVVGWEIVPVPGVPKNWRLTLHTATPMESQSWTLESTQTRAAIAKLEAIFGRSELLL